MPRTIAIWLGLPWRDRWRWLSRKFGEAVLRAPRIATPDRVLLEQRVLPAYAADPSLRSLLFVGCEWYTREYAALFEPTSERFRTIDIDATKARHGHLGHIVAPLQEVASHVDEASVDVVVCNGVYGFGIDTRFELRRAFVAMHTILRPGGTLLLGWNDVPVLALFDPCALALEAGFERAESGVLGAWRVRTETPTRHTFDCYVRSR